jgi:purine-binding chemotaxis protein CheW
MKTAVKNEGLNDYLAVRAGRHDCALPLGAVQSVLRGHQPMTPVPQAPASVAGIMNIRGRIAAVIDLACFLGAQGDLFIEKECADTPQDGKETDMIVVVQHDSEIYGLRVQAVGEVFKKSGAGTAAPPETLPAGLSGIVASLDRQGDKLLAILDISAMLDILCRRPQ